MPCECKDSFCGDCFGEAHADAVDGYEYRTDAAEIVGKVSFTADGFMRADAVVARAGVLEYRQPDGTIRRELWHPDDAKAQLDSLQLMPMTLDHPWDEKPLPLVTTQNAKRLQVGHTGQAVRMDGDNVIAPILVTDGEAIRQAKSGGRRQLSLGYLSRATREDGVYKGVAYTHRQHRKGHNHLALVAKARAGEQATLRLDSREDDRMDTPNLTTVKLDGIDYKASPEVANALTKALTLATTLQAQLDQAKADGEKIRGEKDGLQAKLDEASKKDLKGEIATGVKRRVSLISVAARVLPATIKLDDLSDLDVMKQVIIERMPKEKRDDTKAKLDAATEVYVQARFDAAIEDLPAASATSDALGRQREQTTVRQDASGDIVEASKKRMEDNLRNAWKPKAA